MEPILMSLKILLPFRVFVETKDVRNMVAETNAGSYGFLPQRLDCVAALAPGIFTYETDKIHYLAIDEGILVKTGTAVTLSVRNAIECADLGKLHEAVEKELFDLGDQEKSVRSVMAKLESGLIHSMDKFRKV